jgi:hypothetical protein
VPWSGNVREPELPEFSVRHSGFQGLYVIHLEGMESNQLPLQYYAFKPAHLLIHFMETVLSMALDAGSLYARPMRADQNIGFFFAEL